MLHDWEFSTSPKLGAKIRTKPRSNRHYVGPKSDIEHRGTRHELERLEGKELVSLCLFVLVIIMAGAERRPNNGRGSDCST
jgi:hypothetical protein